MKKSKLRLASGIRDELFEYISEFSKGLSKSKLNRIELLCRRAETLLDSFEWSVAEQFREAANEFHDNPRNNYNVVSLYQRFDDLISSLGVGGRARKVYLHRIDIVLKYSGIKK